jgi:tetratricopeptide (TPR) repeat protein/WD40 repeat protein
MRMGFSPDDKRLAFKIGQSVGTWDVATGAECRVLQPAMLGNRSEARDITQPICADVSPDSRLIATGDAEGVRLWEASAGRELAHLRAGSCESVLFHPDGGSLISSGAWGLYRWPISSDDVRGGDSRLIGPPELMRETTGNEWRRAIWMPDHRTLALVDNGNARVLLIDSRHPHPAWSRATALDSGGNRHMTSVTVSPDGHWLAAGSWREPGVRVWDVRRRRLERIVAPRADEANPSNSYFVGFSADGRWLVLCAQAKTDCHAYYFWRVGTWERGERIDQERNGTAWRPPVFTGDGRLMALAIAPDQVMLADAATGRELARLTTLHSVTPAPIVFSPDGTLLIAGTNQNTVLAWDLRRIRDQLAPMGLDWDAPPYPALPGSSAAPGPVPPPRPVRVAGEVIQPQARRAAELAEMDRRLAANPDDADALIHRGWLRLGLAHAVEAVVDLERGSRLRPDDADALFLLAQAYRQANNLPAARATLETFLARSAGDSDARFTKGQVALQLGRLQEAADDFTKVLDADPGRHPLRYRRALVWLRLGRFEEALADLDPLIQHYPQDPALYALRSQVHDRLGHREQAQADRKQAVESPLAGPEHYNNLAWSLATGPAALRDPEQALALARKAVALTPGTAAYLNTLGVALYRAGRYAEAIPALEQSLAAGKGEFDAFDLFFLAMAHHRLGHADQTRDCFDRAVRWLTERQRLPAQHIAELSNFRAEAEAVLALAGPGAELPADVFAPE